jgi:hypothetical protein
LFEAIAIFLDGGNAIADRLSAPNIGSQKILLRYFLDTVLGRVGGGGKLPTVSRQGDIGKHKNSDATENDSFPRCEIAPHQLLE